MTNQSNEWFIDSAATKHMTSNKSILENYVQYQEPRNNYLGDSTVILAHGESKVKLPTLNSSRKIVLDLHQVLFVPKLTKNVLSVPAMALMEAEIQFDKDKCLVRKNGQEFVIGSLLRMRLSTVMYVVQCKWNRTVVVGTWLRLQMIFHDIQLLISSNPRVKYFQNSWNVSILSRNILVIRLRN